MSTYRLVSFMLLMHYVLTWTTKHYHFFADREALHKCLMKVNHIGLITVFDAILTSRRCNQKLQCLYESPMGNNFFRNLILHNL